ncbi:MAG: hypothetical protein LBS22_03060 [Puniceicoccales bacterium]|nr:hypothetical protein [Puniceicoccales bacterium]
MALFPFIFFSDTGKNWETSRERRFFIPYENSWPKLKLIQSLHDTASQYGVIVSF